MPKFSTSVESNQSELVSSNLPLISIECKDLPSGGKSYPPNSSINYRPYTFGEVKKISQSKMDERSSIEFVLLGIECSSFDKLDLTMGDFMYLGLLRRLSTLGSDKATIPYSCEGCGKIGKHVIETKNLDFDELEVPELPVIGEYNDDFEIHFQPLTIRRMFNLIHLGKSEDEIAMIAAQCVAKVKIETSKVELEMKESLNENFEDFYKMIDGATTQQAELFGYIDRLLYHGLKTVEFNCKELKDTGVCGHTNSIELDGGQALILPFRESEKPIATKVRFGNKSKNKPN